MINLSDHFSSIACRASDAFTSEGVSLVIHLRPRLEGECLVAPTYPLRFEPPEQDFAQCNRKARS
jgi:hypothetical protein